MFHSSEGQRSEGQLGIEYTRSIRVKKALSEWYEGAEGRKRVVDGGMEGYAGKESATQYLCTPARTLGIPRELQCTVTPH